MSEISETERPAPAEPDASVRVPAEVRRRLLRLQFDRKMAGESVSMGEIIGELLEKAGAS